MEAPLVAAEITVTKPEYNKDLRMFMHDVAMRESNNTPTAINKRGYLGKYQFHQRTLHQLGIFVSDETFLNDESLQDSAMVLLLKKNDASLRTLIKQYSGQYYDGVYVTRSGILAGAHLVGIGGVQTFFNVAISPHPTQDSNGTTVQDYMTEFSGYKFKLYQ